MLFTHVWEKMFRLRAPVYRARPSRNLAGIVLVRTKRFAWLLILPTDGQHENLLWAFVGPFKYSLENLMYISI